MWNKPFKGKVKEFYDDSLVNGKHEYTNTGNMKPVSRRLIVDWVIKSWQATPAEMVAHSMKDFSLLLPVDGSQDEMISCLKEGRKCADGRALLQEQMKYPNEESLYENPSKIMEEHVTEAALFLTSLRKMMLMMTLT